MSDSETMQEKRKGEHLAQYQFKEGNPGRPKGSRNKLGEAFLSALHADFEQHGEKVIEKVRTEKPDQYLKVIASTLPKELNVRIDELDELTDDQLDRRIALLLSEYERGARAAAGAQEQAEASQQAPGLSTLQ